MKKINAIFTLLIVLVGTAIAAKPNIIIVITDDQGYGDLACHGNPIIKTPNLGAFHKKAVRLTDYHVSPTCSPTRPTPTRFGLSMRRKMKR